MIRQETIRVVRDEAPAAQPACNNCSDLFETVALTVASFVGSLIVSCVLTAILVRAL